MLAFVCTLTLSFAENLPNVVILLSDDLGYKDIGCYGGPVKTPALDDLAMSGVRFDEFYSGAAVCSPSRASLLTGRHHIRAGVYSWIRNETHRSHLLEREVTLAEILKERGYRTAHFGKWHLGLPTGKMKKPTPSDHGFDYWFATENNAEPSHRNPVNFIRNGKSVGELQGYSCQLVLDEAIRWINDHEPSDQPFFLNIWFHEPHAKVAAPADLVSHYDKPEAVYSGSIENTDCAIARLLTKLEEMGELEKTLIIYTSDNGSYLESRTGNLRGKKGSNWEGGIRVPGIFVWPGEIPAGRTMSGPAGIIDILPTVCGLLGIEKPKGVVLDGCDLSGPLRGQETSFARAKPMFWHLQKSRPIVVLRDGDFCLVADPDYELSETNLFDEKWIPRIREGGYRNFQLFDLATDPRQEHNIAKERPEVLESLKKKLLEINASVMSDSTDWSDVAPATASPPAQPLS